MKNTFFCDKNLTVLLLEAEEAIGNTITLEIDADSTATQVLTIAPTGGTSGTVTLTPSTVNSVAILSAFWASGDDTVITLSKGGTDAGTIVITFPPTIDTDAAVYQTEDGDQTYTMQGTWPVKEKVSELSISVAGLEAKTLNLITPAATSTDTIADGATGTVITFAIECEEAADYAPIAASIGVTVSTTTTGDTYRDCVLAIKTYLDGTLINTQTEAYGDGAHIIALNIGVEDLTAGPHRIKIDFEPTGGGLS